MIVKFKCLALALVTTMSVGLVPAAADTLGDIQERGEVRCGVSQGLPGFSSQSAEGYWTGLDVDLCRAIAAAIFGDSSKVSFTPLSAKARAAALTSGDVDLLARNTTWSAAHELALGFNFAGVNFYDGQGFTVRKSMGVASALQLTGSVVCTTSGSTSELNLQDYITLNRMLFEVVTYEKADEVLQAYDSGRCDAYTTDMSALYAQRTLLRNPFEHVILPEVISKEPLGPVVRQGDDLWFNLVKWSLNVMINAEELSVTQANVLTMRSSNDPAVKSLLDGRFGTHLGLGVNWAYDIIRSVGNYGESFEANLGTATPIGLNRGLNELWTKGGLMYAPPFR
jgi:general L-amino acid transport system substrate-binding protein